MKKALYGGCFMSADLPLEERSLNVNYRVFRNQLSGCETKFRGFRNLKSGNQEPGYRVNRNRNVGLSGTQFYLNS
jgi:hypothetical protein